eukprot:TRINITY_DN7069_c0_g1_i4.p2 TRINITY_DN7069_c0_g1~~TRINITY_DN7069_c0_g1_i4.p2  ORF type:complete len:578 (+),score=74.00 TRINITY_DN7069_c0_g1_i4:2744-4477(+)
MDLVLFAGGYSSVSLRESDVVDLFNSTARNWYNARLSAPRQYLAGISTSEIALFAGGLGGGFSDVVDIYNVTSNTWISATLGVGRGMIYPTGVSIGDRIFVGDGGFLNVFDFSPATTASSSLVSSLSSTVSSQTMYSESISTTATSSSFSVISTVTSMERSTTATSDDGRTSTSFTSSQSIETSDIRSSNIISNDLSSSETTSSNVDTSSLSTFTSSSENDTMEDRNSSQLSKEVLATVIVIPIVLAIVSTALVFFIIRKKRDVGADVPLEEASGLDANRHLVDTKPELTSVTVLHKLGEGSFGQVYYGRWQGTPVALKKLNQEEYKAFRKEAAILSTINHPNVIQFLGLYTSNDGFQYMVTEYAANGSLDRYLIEKGSGVDINRKIGFLLDATKGMQYLASRKIIHRDLACRNLLVNKGHEVLVGDFGLSRYGEEYHVSSEAKIPIRWTAIEVLENKIATTASDVWSFGIVCWEVFENGTQPYHNYSFDIVLNALRNGERLPKPDLCPDIVWDMMKKCWNKDPSERPSFSDILTLLESAYDDTECQQSEAYVEVGIPSDRYLRSPQSISDRDYQPP